MARTRDPVSGLTLVEDLVEDSVKHVLDVISGHNLCFEFYLSSLKQPFGR
jgi:hypothetical protein